MGVNVSFFVQGKPVSLNRAYKPVRPRARRDGKKARKVALRPEAEIWKETVYYETLNALPQARYPRRLFIPPIKISLVFYGVNSDADNLLKLTLDGLKHAIGVDDKFFELGGARVERFTAHQGVKITIEGA